LTVCWSNIDAQDTPERFRVYTLLQKSDVLSLTLAIKSKAECCLKEAEATAEKYNSRDLQVYVSRSLYKFHLANGNISLANKYKLEYLEKKTLLSTAGRWKVWQKCDLWSSSGRLMKPLSKCHASDSGRISRLLIIVANHCCYHSSYFIAPAYPFIQKTSAQSSRSISPEH
jgi:hypothetical protein